MRIVLIGAPGSGKGTQAKLLAERYRIPHISTGDLLRSAISNDTAFSEKYKDVLESGQLVPDEAVRELLEERLRRKDTKRGFVVDGYPRNIPQAQELDNLLGMMGRPLQIGVYTEVDNETLIKRITGRLNCTGCGAIYNKHFSPPTKATKCDKCGSKLEKRKDDNAKTVAARVEVYNQNTVPLITYYRAQHKLRTVAAIDSVDVIHAKICAIVDLEIRPLEVDEVFAATDTIEEAESTVIAGGLINKVEPDLEAIARKEAQIAKKAEQRAEEKAAAEAATQKTSKKKAKKKAAAKKAPKTTEIKVAKAPTKAAKKATKKKASKKKATPKKTAVKPTPKKPTATKAAKKKVTSKKATAKKTAKKKVTSKKVTKKVTKKAATKKTAAKKVTRKSAAKKASKKKTIAKKKSTPKKAPAKKKVTKKITKKKVAKKAAKKKTFAKKITKKSVAKKVAKKKTAAKKKKK